MNKIFVNVCSQDIHGLNECFLNFRPRIVHVLNELPVNVRPCDFKDSGYIMSESGLNGLNGMNVFRL